MLLTGHLRLLHKRDWGGLRDRQSDNLPNSVPVLPSWYYQQTGTAGTSTWHLIRYNCMHFHQVANLVDNIRNKDHIPTTTIERNIHNRTAWAWFYIIVQSLRTFFVEVNHYRVLLCRVQNVPWLRDYYKL